MKLQNSLDIVYVISYFVDICNKDTNRKIRKTEFIYICGSKNGSSGGVNTGEVWGDVSRTEKALCMSCKDFGTKI